MNMLDLFAGIGGFSLAGHWMGWKTVAFVDNDEGCQKVLHKNFPDVPIFGDIVQFNNDIRNGKITIEKPDIICGGFPCQPFSNAGKREGTDDSRYLWPAMLETIRIFKPTFVVGENVSGLVSMDNGKTLDTILSDLENEGYKVESFVIPACSIGAWHRRSRIFFIAYTDNCGSGRRGGSDGEEDRVQGEYRSKIHSGLSCGTGDNVADSKDDRCRGSKSKECGEDENRVLQKEQEGGTMGCETQGCDRKQDDADSGRDSVQGMESGSQPSGNGRQVGLHCGEGSRKGRNAECGLDKLAHGVPNRLEQIIDLSDGFSYWENEPIGVPRVIEGDKQRVRRLKQLGNAIVPQVAYEIFKNISKL